MVQFLKAVVFVSCTVFGTFAVWADEGTPLKIIPVAGKEVCQSATVDIARRSAEAQLCVKQGNFSHDLYTLNLNQATLIQGIDDEMSVGLSARFRSQRVDIKCVSQNIFPKQTHEEMEQEIQKIAPAMSVGKRTELIGLMKGSAAGMEIGRLCAISSDGAKLMTVQVSFIQEE